MDGEELTILLIEDSDADAMLIERAFRKAEIRNPILHLNSGLAALKFLQAASRTASARPIFILLDLSLPDLSGYEVLHWVRHHPLFSTLPVVIVTGSLHPQEAEATKASGANAFFPKTLSFQDLSDLVNSVGAHWRLKTVSEESSRS